MKIQDLENKARELRKVIFKMICKGGGGHIPASLSIVEILTVLYCRVLNVNPVKPKDPKRDRFILSKGHAGVSLYAILADKGFFDKKCLDTFGKCGTILGGHPDMHKVPGDTQKGGLESQRSHQRQPLIQKDGKAHVGSEKRKYRHQKSTGIYHQGGDPRSPH